MSYITLFNTAAYNPEDMPVDLTLKSMPMRRVKAPENSLVMLYGFHEALKETSHFINDAYRVGNRTINVEMQFDIGDYSVKNQANLDNIKSTNFLNLIHMSSELETHIRKCWLEIIREKGLYETNLPEDYWSNRNYLMRDASLLGELRKFEAFKHVDLISFFFEHEKIHTLCRRVAVFSYDHLINVEKKTTTDINIKLPKLEGVNS